MVMISVMVTETVLEQEIHVSKNAWKLAWKIRRAVRLQLMALYVQAHLVMYPFFVQFNLFFSFTFLQSYSAWYVLQVLV